MAEPPFSRYILQLAEKWKNNSITESERNEFIEWYNSFDDSELLWPGDDNIKAELFAEISGQINDKKTIPFRKHRWKIIASAAAAVVIIFLSVSYYKNVSVKAVSPAVSSKISMPLPGTDRAILVLGNGRRIELKNQNVIQDGENTIVNRANELIYNNSMSLAYNTMITPRGGQYRLQLPDGSRVWLNAESKIIYPTIFTGNERKVQLEGEAYFEVVNDKRTPFRVSSPSGTIQVLGTKFNVNDYPNEVFNTTLLDGAVKVNNKLITPGQAYIKGVVTQVDTSEVVAWKNGFFTFKKTNIQVVLRQLMRWYDLEITYEAGVPKKSFVGELPRNAPLDQVLRVLSKTGLRFKMEGKKMIVTN